MYAKLGDVCSVRGVPDTVWVDGEHGLSFRQTRGVVDLADASVPSTFTQVQPERKHTDHSVLQHIHPLINNVKRNYKEQNIK